MGMKQDPPIFAFNRGVVSPLALARSDQKRLALSARTMNNMISRVLGPMSFRPGWGYKGGTYSNQASRFLKFVFSTSDTSLVELTDGVMRVWINDVLLTRPTANSAVTNGTFAGNITGWTDGSDSGGAVAYEASNHMKLTSNGTARAIGYQAVTTSSAGIEHGLRIVVDRGPITLRVGSTNGDDDYVSETSLDEGTHSIAFTPSGTFYIQFSSTTIYKKLLKQCTIEAAGVMTLATPWTASYLSKVRYDQSGDVIFVAVDGIRQAKIERRGTRPAARSWSFCYYFSDDGPFKVQNTGPNQLTASATTGDITLAATTPLFKSTHVGALFSLTSTGQSATASIAAQNTFTSSIKITGVGTGRSFGISITGTWSATVTLQRSTDNATWTDVGGWNWTANVSTSLSDGLDNQTIYYRIGIKTGDYTSGTAVVALTYTAGTQRGVVRVTAFSSSTSVSAQVLQELGGTSATSTWQEGMWSNRQGWPTSVRLHQGRLWWFGRNGIWGSVSDSYYSHDETETGNSGPINRTIGSGPVDVINFGLSLQRLVIGAEGKEVSIRSSALDTPLTPTDFNMMDASTQGSAAVEAWKVDQKGVYVHRNGIKVYELSFDVQSYDYNSSDLMEMCPELGAAGIVRMDIQRQPDTRIHCVLSDGTAIISTYSRTEEVLAWQTVDTDGDIEDVVTLPAVSNTREDQVYYVVKRTINGSTVRYLEKWAEESDCRGAYSTDADRNMNMDCYLSGTNSPASMTVSGLSHLEGCTVVAWADGAPVLSGTAAATFTVSSGAISLPSAATKWVVGLVYTGRWGSTKLGQMASALDSLYSQNKRITRLGILLAYFHRYGIKWGADFDHLDMMPKIEAGTTAALQADTYEDNKIPFPTHWQTDLQLCMQIQSPFPGTVLGVAPDVEIP